MKIPNFLLSALVAGSVAFDAMADLGIVTTIDGVDTGRVISKITFDEDFLTLTFSDNTTETADMSLVTVLLGSSAGSMIESVVVDAEQPSGVYNLKGQRVADTPSGLLPGVYVVNNQKILVR